MDPASPAWQRQRNENLQETRDLPARAPTVLAPGSGRVENDWKALADEVGPEVGQLPVEAVALLGSVRGLRREDSPEGVGFQRDKTDALAFCPLPERARQRRLPDRGRSGDPDRPRHGVQRPSRLSQDGRRSASKRSASRISRRNRKSARRVASDSCGYQSGLARTSARNAK